MWRGTTEPSGCRAHDRCYRRKQEPHRKVRLLLFEKVCGIGGSVRRLPGFGFKPCLPLCKKKHRTLRCGDFLSAVFRCVASGYNKMLPAAAVRSHKRLRSRILGEKGETPRLTTAANSSPVRPGCFDVVGHPGLERSFAAQKLSASPAQPETQTG